jgi:hypothetical protein
MTEENCEHKQNLIFAINLPPNIFFLYLDIPDDGKEAETCSEYKLK